MPQRGRTCRRAGGWARDCQEPNGHSRARGLGLGTGSALPQGPRGLMSGKEKACLAKWPWASGPKGRVTGCSRRFWLQSQRALVSSSVLATCPQQVTILCFSFLICKMEVKTAFPKIVVKTEKMNKVFIPVLDTGQEPAVELFGHSLPRFLM